MTKRRRRFGAEFKLKVALEAVEGLKRLNELSGEHGLHPNQVGSSKRKLLDGGAAVVSDSSARQLRGQETPHAELYEQIGRLRMELEWLKKRLPGTVEANRAMIEHGHSEVSVRRQCELIGLNRSSLSGYGDLGICSSLK